MALFGRRTAIVSLGVSCQTAHQVARAQALIARLADDVFVDETTPFDWRIVSAFHVERMIALSEFYPASAAELVGTKRPYWPRHRCHFWHDPAGSFAAFSSKQAHLLANWGKITRFERKVFILSNTQGNLPQKAIAPGGFDYRFDPDQVVGLAHTLGRYFERPELHVVTDKARFDQLDQLTVRAKDLKGARLGVHFVGSQAGGWQGDDRQWDGALRAIIQ